MAYIRLDVSETIYNGMPVTFNAPCACNAVDGLKVYYPTIVDDVIATESKVFTFRDAHGNNLAGVGNLFTSGVYAKAILDVDGGYAYIQNADTNGYLERRLNVRTAVLSSASWSSSAPYTQAVNVADVKADDQPIISVGVPSTQDSASYKALNKAYGMLDRAVSGNGIITFYCYSKKPTVDIPILIKGA